MSEDKNYIVKSRIKNEKRSKLLSRIEQSIRETTKTTKLQCKPISKSFASFFSFFHLLLSLLSYRVYRLRNYRVLQQVAKIIGLLQVV